MPGSRPEQMADKMSIKVSVVVPVYNSGKFIDPCIRSLLAQTLPADEFVVIFVDDGSTDGTPARLDKLAAEHPQIRVIHIPNSGWPGKPRNVGVEAAHGEYVQFIDHDDHLAPDALRRLYEMGRRNHADIVIGKVASNFRFVPMSVFRHTRESCTIHDAPLIDSLTPHKMFRIEFLRENKIAFPEGKRRLEDHPFVVKAYLRAKTVSILGDYTCYFYDKRTDGKNAASTLIDPAGYYGNLREVLDVVVANTEPGDFRDRLLRRFCWAEMLARLSEPAMLKYEAGYRDQMIDEVRQVSLDYMNDNVRAGMGAVRRLRFTLLRENQRAKLLELAERCDEVKAKTRLDGLRWDGGRLAFELSAHLCYGPDDAPVPLLCRGDNYFVDPGCFPGVGEGDSDLLDVTAEVSSLRAEIFLRRRGIGIEWPVAPDLKVRIEELGVGSTAGAGAQAAGSTRCRAVLRAAGYLDPQHAGAAPLDRGVWDVRVRVHFLGLAREARPGADRAPDIEEHLLPAMLGGPAAQLVIPYFTDPGGNLSLDVDRSGKKLGNALSGRQVLPLPGGGREIEVRLDVVATAGTAEAEAWLVLRGRDPASVPCALPGRLRPVQDRMHLVVDVQQGRSAWAPRPPRAGVWYASAWVDGKKGPEVKLGRALVDGKGWVRLDETLGEVSPGAVCGMHRAHAIRRGVRKVLWRAARPVARRLPPGPRKSLGRLVRKLGL
jgi:poly(ribitol-phosphate) beta-N-acetylglucosaminyltransferase